MVGDRYTTVKHPNASATLDGETTRRAGLNSDRGSGPLNAQREVGKREPQPEQSGEKLPTPGEAPKGSQESARVSLGVLRLDTVRVPQPKGHISTLMFLLVFSFFL
jgi:hypothetical protein